MPHGVGTLAIVLESGVGREILGLELIEEE